MPVDEEAISCSGWFCCLNPYAPGLQWKIVNGNVALIKLDLQATAEPHQLRS